MPSLVGSEMCIRDRDPGAGRGGVLTGGAYITRGTAGRWQCSPPGFGRRKESWSALWRQRGAFFLSRSSPAGIARARATPNRNHVRLHPLVLRGARLRQGAHRDARLALGTGSPAPFPTPASPPSRVFLRLRGPSPPVAGPSRRRSRRSTAFRRATKTKTRTTSRAVSRWTTSISSLRPCPRCIPRGRRARPPSPVVRARADPVAGKRRRASFVVSSGSA